jgi:uncharacterized membrane protein YdcZ (DUF606 family)
MSLINVWLIAPLMVGFFVVSQSLLNKLLGQHSGLPIAVLINASVFFLLSIALLILTLKVPDIFPNFLIPRWTDYQFRWWHLLPGIFGFFLVLITPWAILNLQVGTVFLLSVSTQIILGIAWDLFSKHSTLNFNKTFAICSVITGVYFYTR